MGNMNPQLIREYQSPWIHVMQIVGQSNDVLVWL